MKFKWADDAAGRIVSNIIIIFAAIAFYFFMQNLSVFFIEIRRVWRILTPFITGFIIAYLLSGPVEFYEHWLCRHFFKKHCRYRSINRMLATTLVILSVIIAVALIFYFIIPQLFNSVITLANNMPGYADSFTSLMDRLIKKFKLGNDYIIRFSMSWRDLLIRISERLDEFLPKIIKFSKQLTSGVMNFIFGFIISIYLVNSKEKFTAQLKKLLFAIFPNRFVTALVRIGRYSNKTFGSYILGQLLVSLVIGILSFLLMTMFRMDYALLISFIIAITNIIPFFGPFIGAIPSIFILLMADPSKVLWFILLVIFIHQLEGNFIAPRIVGKKTGLPAFWVIFAIFIGGGLFGIAGIVLGVPAFSILYVLLKNILEKRLETKGMPIETGSYNSNDYPL